MAGAGRKRRQILVDADLQIGLSMHILGWLYFYIVTFALLANAPAMWAVLTANAADAAYYDAVQRLQWFTQYTALPLAVTFVCVAVHGVVFTHRVAGPIHRIKATLRDLAQRRLTPTPVLLRPKDYFKDVASDLSSAIDTVRDDAARQRRMNEETLVAAREAIEALEKGRASHETLALAHLVLDRAERLDRHLAAATDPAAPAPSSPESAAVAVPAGPQAA
jgi:hypothetical protein